VLVSERIPPLPKEVRGEVVLRHVPAPAPHQTWDFDRPTEPDAWRAWEDAQHDHLFWRSACLLRVYLRRNAWRTLRSSVHRPSNVCVMGEDLRALGIDARQVVSKMADTLAVVFWGAGMDGRGVEFVIAPPRTDEEGNIAEAIEYWESPVLGSCTLWVVDFDECRPMCMCEKGIEQGVEAFLRNAPYFPSLVQDQGDDDGLGKFYISQFKGSSHRILEAKGRWLKDGWMVGQFIRALLESVSAGVVPEECLEEEWQSRMDSNKRFIEMWHRRCENTRDSDESESDIERKKKVNIQPYQGYIKEEENLHMCRQTDDEEQEPLDGDMEALSSTSDDESLALEESGSSHAKEEKTDLHRELPWLLLEDDDAFDSDSDPKVGIEKSNLLKTQPGTPPGPLKQLFRDIWHLGKEMIQKPPPEEVQLYRSSIRR
jgi:Zinc finger protein